MLPLKFLPIIEFEKRMKSMDKSITLELMDSMHHKIHVFGQKEKAKQFKEKGNEAYNKKQYEKAEKFISEAIKMNVRSRPLWTNRAACRFTMKKYEETISDCNTALSIDPKCVRTILQKGNALLSLSRFDEAKECYESLRSLGESTSADTHLKKLNDIQDKISYFSIDFQHTLSYKL